MLMSLVSMAQQQLTVGDVTMTISPEKGARILSLQYKGQEVISQLTAPESFGSTFWTSPQKEWNWPPVREFDKMPYQVEEHDGSLIMTSEVSRRLKYRVRKEFTTDKKDNAIVVTYSIINESDETRQVAPVASSSSTHPLTASPRQVSCPSRKGMVQCGIIPMKPAKIAKSMPMVRGGMPIATTACCY